MGSARFGCQSEALGLTFDRTARRDYEPVPKNWIAVPVLNAPANGVVVRPERRIASSVNSRRSDRETGPYVQ